MRDQRESISATELAKLGLCEVRLQLDARYGQGRASRVQEQYKVRGREVHARALAAAEHAAPPRDSRCFIATALYGAHAPETEALRCWRDRFLRQHGLGRIVIRVYYAVSPPLAGYLLRHPGLAAGVRRVLDRLVAAVVRTDIPTC